MYLKKLVINNFRSCKDTTIEFHEDLTILVGENNSGKSNVLDAIRLVTIPLNERRDRWCDDDDITHDSEENRFEVASYFHGLNGSQKGLLLTALTDRHENEAILGLEYKGADKKADRPRGKIRYWTGQLKNNESEPEARQYIRHIYLPALRDAQYVLNSSKGDRIQILLKHIFDPETIKEFESEAKVAFDELNENKVIKESSEKISKIMNKLTNGAIPHQSNLEFSEAKLAKLAKNLRFKLGKQNLDPIDIAYSGLGYANLLFMASILVELTEIKEVDLTLLLVEEPEAHLHPQLQTILLEILKEYSSQKNEDDSFPEGKIQVIVTTHSPNLTAAVPLKNIVVVRSSESNPINTVTIPLQHLGLELKEERKIERYLDVTRASLLFGRRILFVEGISEALLIPVMARHILFKNDEEKLRKFIGSTILAIGGVDFSPYINLLCTPYDMNHIASQPVVIITDNDQNPSFSEKTKENRRKSLTKLEDKLNSNGNIFTADYTFEAELFNANDPEIFKGIYRSIHNRSIKKWENKIENELSSNIKTKNFVDLIKKEKGEFAHLLSDYIENNNTVFNVPEYIELALNKLVER